MPGYLLFIRSVLDAAPWLPVVIKVCMALAPAVLIWEVVRKTRAGRSGYGPVVGWAAVVWGALVLNEASHLLPPQSVPRVAWFWTRFVIFGLWVIWGVGWIVPFLNRDGKQRRGPS